MDKLSRFIAFVQYIIAAWHQTFGRKKSLPSQADQTTAEQIDQEAWERARKRYVESMKKTDDDFWKGEGER